MLWHNNSENGLIKNARNKNVSGSVICSPGAGRVEQKRIDLSSSAMCIRDRLNSVYLRYEILFIYGKRTIVPYSVYDVLKWRVFDGRELKGRRHGRRAAADACVPEVVIVAVVVELLHEVRPTVLQSLRVLGKRRSTRRPVNGRADGVARPFERQLARSDRQSGVAAQPCRAPSVGHIDAFVVLARARRADRAAARPVRTVPFARHQVTGL